MEGGILNDLVSALYDAALDAQRWPHALEAIGAALGDASAILAVHPLSGGLLWASVSKIDPAALPVYETGFSSPDTNPYLKACGHLPLGEPLIGEHIAAPQPFVETDFYTTILRPLGLRYAVVMTLFRDQGTVAAMAFLRGAASGEFSAKDLAMLRALAPHLTRAVHLTLRAEHLAARSSALAEIVSASHTGMLLIDAESNVAFMNPAAAAIVREGDGLLMDGGRLLIRDHAAHGRLVKLLSAAGVDAVMTNARRARYLAVERPSGHHPYGIAIWPLRVGPGIFRVETSNVLVLITDPTLDATPPSELLSRMYGLTPAEAQLAGLLARGLDLKEAAGRLSVTLTTVKSHLRQILAKTNTRRQAGLVRLLLQFPPAPRQ